MRAHHALVHGLLSEGMGLRAIARHLGRHTVQRYARAARWQDMVTGRSSRPSRLDIHQPYLQRRIDETDGTITIIELREELAGRGHQVPYSRPTGGSGRAAAGHAAGGWSTSSFSGLRKVP